MSEKSSSQPLFRNGTAIDQVVYDESYSPILIPSGKPIRGEWYRKYAGKGGPLVLVGKDKGREGSAGEKEQEGAGGKGTD